MQKQAENGSIVLDVLVLIDNFSPEFIPLTLNNKSWGLNRFHLFTYLDLCLEWVSWLESPNVVVAMAGQSDVIAQQLYKKWAVNFKHLQVVHLQNCNSINDMLREVETRHLLANDFILIQNCATFSSSNFSKEIENFKLRRRQNKNSLITLLYRGKRKEEGDECTFPLIGYNLGTQKLVHYKFPERNRKLRIPKASYLTETTFRTDLTSCGIIICAKEFSTHFSGNYDLQTFDGILLDILSNEEFLSQQIHIDIVQDMSAFVIDSYSSLLLVHRLFIERSFFPLTLDNVFPNFEDFNRLEHSFKDRNVYLPNGASALQLLPSLGIKDCLLGKKCIVETGAKIYMVTMGECAKIGKNAVLRNSVVGENIQIGEGAMVEDSIIGDNVNIGAGAKVKHCLLGDEVTISPDEVLESGSILQKGKPPTIWSTSDIANEQAPPHQEDWSISFREWKNNQFLWIFCQNGQPSRKGNLCFWNAGWTAISISNSPRSGRKPRRSKNSSSSSLPDDDDTDGGEETEPIDVTYQANYRAFVAEVGESLEAVMQEKNESGNDGGVLSTEQASKVKLEISASKLAYNIPADEMPKYVFSAFLKLPEVGGRFSIFTKIFKQLNPLWEAFFNKTEANLLLLQALEEYALENECFRTFFPNVLHFFNQDQLLLGEKEILNWYSGLAENSILRNVPKLADLIQWLEESDEENNDAEQEEED